MTILDDDGGAQPTEEFYTYDAIGNMLSKTGVGTYTNGANGNGTGAGPHRIKQINGGAAFVYDPNGNLSNGGGASYTWDYENRPLTISTTSGSESYAYDADGERVKVVAGSTTTVYLGGLWEETSAGATKAYYTFGGQMVAVRDSTDPTDPVSYLHGDHLGSVSVASGAGASNKGSQRFDPWGKRISGAITQTQKNYTGQYLDSTGLLYYHARYYDPTLARFVSADTVVPEVGALAVWPSDATASPLFAQGPKNKDGKPTAPQNPQTLNRYSYVENNPVRSVDPTGHMPPYCVFTGECTPYAIYHKIQDDFHRFVYNLAATIVQLSLPGFGGENPGETNAPSSEASNLLKPTSWQQAERMLSKRLDVPHNEKEFFEEGIGMIKPRKPDFIARDKGYIAESKWAAKYIGISDQLRDTALLAEKWGVRYDLYVRQGARVSSSVVKLIEDTGGKVIKIFE